MKIHFLVTKDILTGGGIETYTREVGSRLADRGHEVTVYSTRGAGATPSMWEGMRIVWLPKVRPYWAEKFFGAGMAAWKAFLADSPDVLHLHSVAAGAMASFLRHKGAACIVQMHGIEWMRSRWGGVARNVLRFLERSSLAYGDAFTAVSKTQCEYFADNYDTRCEYIPTAAPLKEHAEAKLILDLGLQPKDYVLFAARLVPEKGVHYLISAFRRLATNQALVIAGDAQSAAYHRRLLDLAGDDPRIKFLGSVRGRLLEELFSNASLFVQPSELEGLSIGLIEAMSYRLQCVASDIPENKEVIGDAGVLFKNKDVDDLERVLRGSIEDRAAAVEIGARARQRVEEMFCWDRVVDQLEALYQRAVSGAGHQQDASRKRLHRLSQEPLPAPIRIDKR
jgi:glycosyltransferase involved in cell wall biosynthesis